jgi:hypothetical protein
MRQNSLLSPARLLAPMKAGRQSWWPLWMQHWPPQATSVWV